MQLRHITGWQMVPALFTGTLVILAVSAMASRKDVAIAAAVVVSGAGLASWMIL